MKPSQLELHCIEDAERTADSGWLRGVRVAIDPSPTVDSRLPDDESILTCKCISTISVTRLKRAGRRSEMIVVDGPSGGAERLAAAHGARVVLRHPWNGGA